MAQAMVSTHHPDSKVIVQRHQLLLQGLKTLQKLATQRRKRLVDSVSRHEFLREADSILEWIGEQMTTAASEDYGQDFEHLLVRGLSRVLKKISLVNVSCVFVLLQMQILQNKFENFKHQISAISYRFDQCDDIARRLIANENPYAADFPAKQEQLR